MNLVEGLVGSSGWDGHCIISLLLCIFCLCLEHVGFRMILDEMLAEQRLHSRYTHEFHFLLIFVLIEYRPCSAACQVSSLMLNLMSRNLERCNLGGSLSRV